jgi:2'-5' RNA ligase
MRAFLGIPITQDVVSKIANVQKRLSTFDIKFVEKENLHFNLKFFRHIEEEKIDQLKETVKETCEKFERFDINISGLGAFPSKNYIRVIWLGVKDGHNELVALANMIDNALETLGFEKEKQKFIPHLTLGRVRSGRNKEKMKEIVKELENIEIGSMKLDKVVLFQSKLGPNGPVYEDVFSIEL